MRHMSLELKALMPAPMRNINLYDVDLNLQFEIAHRVEPKDRRRAELWLRELGRVAGNELDRLARLADVSPPYLRQYDQEGRRIDTIEHHHTYRVMELIAFDRFALAAMSHRPGLLGWPVPVPHAVKCALSYLFVQSEFGLYSAVATTDALARLLRRFGSPELRSRYLPHLTSTDTKTLWQAAISIAEPQGGSDVGAIRTIARREGDVWRLQGHKSFCSNVGAQLILTLARPEGAGDGIDGLGLFLVPRLLADGQPNAIRIHRLKDHLGSRSLATGEIILDRALAYPIGDRAHVLRQLAELVTVSQLSNAMRFAALMRRALHEAVTHAAQRRAFGQRLLDLPLLRMNVTDLLLEVEAATAITLFTAQVLDRADAGDEGSRTLIRILAPLAKHAIARRARWATGEAMDVLGGAGYGDDQVTARLVRDAHLGSIWDGTSNLAALDILRTIRRDEAQLRLQATIQDILESCHRPGPKELAQELQSAGRRLIAHAATVAARDPLRREPAARTIADALYDLLAAVLLTQEAQWQLEDGGGARKLLVARLFAERHRLPQEPRSADAPILSEEQFDALFRWTSLGIPGTKV